MNSYSKLLTLICTIGLICQAGLSSYADEKNERQTRAFLSGLT